MHLVGNAQVYDELVQKWKSFGLISRGVCVASGTLVQHHAPGSPESAPAKDDPSVVEGVAEFVSVPHTQHGFKTCCGFSNTKPIGFSSSSRTASWKFDLVGGFGTALRPPFRTRLNW